MDDMKFKSPGMDQVTKAELWQALAKLGRYISSKEPDNIWPEIYIYGAPERSPALMNSNDCLPFDDYANLCYAQEETTGLIVTFGKEDYIVLQNRICVIGPFAMFRADENGSLASVTSMDYDRALALFQEGADRLSCGSFSAPALRFRAKGGSSG